MLAFSRFAFHHLRTVIALATLASFTTISAAQTSPASTSPVKIGVLSDMTGFFSDATGTGTVVAARMAVEDFGGTIFDRPIQILSGDHQHKADVGSSIARRWIDQEGVSMITGIDNSAVALAVQAVGNDNSIITISTGAGAEDLTESQCSSYGIHYTYDTYALAKGLVRTIYQSGGTKWYIIGSDYAFGHAMAAIAEEELTELGGQSLGKTFAPINSHDFSSFIVRAQSSGADVIGLANAGGETVNAIKAATNFGLVEGGQSLAGFLVTLPDVRAMGLDSAAGLHFVTAFYWDRDTASRKWSERYFEKQKSMPTMMQASVYSAVMTYLKSVEKAGTLDSASVRTELGSTKIDDFFVKDGHILPNGLMKHDMYLAKVKTPESAQGEWDVLDIVKTIPADDAFRPLESSKCALLEGRK